MNELSINATTWTIEAEGVTQEIKFINNSIYQVRRRAAEWTSWHSHLNDGHPRNIVQSFDTLEEATKFAVDLVKALVDVQTAHEALDAITGKMRVG